MTPNDRTKSLSASANPVDHTIATPDLERVTKPRNPNQSTNSQMWDDSGIARHRTRAAHCVSPVAMVLLCALAAVAATLVLLLGLAS